MRYQDDRERSGELLRLALPLMSKQSAGFHPASYAVWYEYVAGANATLRTAIDGRLKDERPISDDEIQVFFDGFISGRDAEHLTELEALLRKMLEKINDSALSLGTEAARYGESLSEYGTKLEQSADGASLRQVIGVLMAETSRMQGSTSTLNDQLQASGREIHELREQLEKAEGDALIDPLTGLCNRRGFERAIQQFVQSMSAEAVAGALLMADIDHFKRINDTYGHLVGDDVIRAVANGMRLSIKGRDTAARYGGEEFAVLLPETQLPGALQLAEQVRLTVARTRLRSPKHVGEIGVTISIGVAELNPGESLENLIERADAALYRAKESGRNRVTRAVI